MSFAFSYSVIARLVIVLAIPTALLIISAGVILWYRGMRPAKFFTLGWTAFLGGTIIFGLSKLGFLPHNVLTENALQVGATIEVLLSRLPWLNVSTKSGASDVEFKQHSWASSEP